MKKHIIVLTILSTIVVLTRCGLDNITPPTHQLNGKVVFNEELLNVRHGKISLNIYQEDYIKNEPIKVYVAQDGTFSALLYNGKYTIEAINNNGPWLNHSDTQYFEIPGVDTLYFDVKPYFLLKDVAIVLDGHTVKSVCNVEQISEDATLLRLSLFVNNTKFVDENNYNYQARQNLRPVKLEATLLIVR